MLPNIGRTKNFSRDSVELSKFCLKLHATGGTRSTRKYCAGNGGGRRRSVQQNFMANRPLFFLGGRLRLSASSSSSSSSLHLFRACGHDIWAERKCRKEVGSGGRRKILEHFRTFSHLFLSFCRRPRGPACPLPRPGVQHRPAAAGRTPGGAGGS